MELQAGESMMFQYLFSILQKNSKTVLLWVIERFKDQ